MTQENKEVADTIKPQVFADEDQKKGFDMAHDAGYALQNICHGIALNAGWWTNLQTGETFQRPVPELLCLVHSEISEALEGFRKDLMDDKLPHRKMLEVELADAVIRIFDMAGGYGLDLGGAIQEKLLFNTSREDHKLENRKAEGGKKI